MVMVQTSVGANLQKWQKLTAVCSPVPVQRSHHRMVMIFCVIQKCPALLISIGGLHSITTMQHLQVTLGSSKQQGLDSHN